MSTPPGAPTPHLVSVSGQDGPGIAERVFAALAERGVDVEDVEQVRVHGRLLLCMEVAMLPGEVDGTLAALTRRLDASGVEVTVDPLVEAEVGRATERHLVTVLAPDIDAATLEGVAGRIAGAGATSSGSSASPSTRCTATSCPWPAPTSTACGVPWPRRPHAARSTSRSRLPGCTAEPNT